MKMIDIVLQTAQMRICLITLLYELEKHDKI